VKFYARSLDLENKLAKVPGRAPLRVRLHVRKGIIGSVVRVLDEESALLGMRELNGAEGCGGQGSPVAHVAVGRFRHSPRVLAAWLADNYRKAGSQRPAPARSPARVACLSA